MFKRDADGPVRQAVQKVGGAIQRVDDPAPGRVCALGLGTFLAEKAISRARAEQILAQNAFGLPVGAGHEVAGALGRNLKVLDLAKVLDQGAAHLAGCFLHQVQVCAALHAVRSIGFRSRPIRVTGADAKGQGKERAG